MLGILLVAVTAVIVIVVVGIAIDKNITESEQETRTIEKTVECTYEFEEVTATITYPDGETERLSYDKTRTRDETVEFVTLDSDSFGVRAGRRSAVLEPDIQAENTREFVLSNIRDIDRDRTAEFVAVAEVPIVKEQYKSGEVWFHDSCKLDTDDDFELDVTIWRSYEWEEHKERQD